MGFDDHAPGVCRSCRQRSEIVASGMCEDCLKKKDIFVDKNPRPPAQPQIEGQQQTMQPQASVDFAPQQTGIRETYLNYIIAHAQEDDKFVPKIVRNALKSLKETYLNQWGWVGLIEGIRDEKVLLAIATELGYKDVDDSKIRLEEELIAVKAELKDEQSLSDGFLSQVSNLKRELKDERNKAKTGTIKTVANGDKAKAENKPAKVVHSKRKASRIPNKNT